MHVVGGIPLWVECVFSRACCLVWVEDEVVCPSPVCLSCRYDWMFTLPMFMSLRLDVKVMSSA